MKKTLLSILVSFGLVACGGGGGGDGSSSKKDNPNPINPRVLEKIETTNTLILTDGEKFLVSYLLAPPSKQSKSQDDIKDNSIFRQEKR